MLRHVFSPFLLCNNVFYMAIDGTLMKSKRREKSLSPTAKAHYVVITLVLLSSLYPRFNLDEGLKLMKIVVSQNKLYDQLIMCSQL